MSTESIKYEFEITPISPELQKITNDFLEAFAVQYGKEHGKRDDGFGIKFHLPSAIIQSNMYQKDMVYDDSTPLMGMSTISDQMAKAEFQFKTRETFKDVAELVEKYKDNKNDRIRVKLVSDTIKVGKFMEFKDGASLEFHDVDKDYREVILRITNTNNPLDLQLTVNFEPEDKYSFPNKHGIDNISVKSIPHKEVVLTRKFNKSEFTHYRYCAEVNGFYYAMEGILFSIQHPEEF